MRVYMYVCMYKSKIALYLINCLCLCKSLKIFILNEINITKYS